MNIIWLYGIITHSNKMKMRDGLGSRTSVFVSPEPPPELPGRELTRKLRKKCTSVIESSVSSLHDQSFLQLKRHQSAPGNYIVDKLLSLSISDIGESSSRGTEFNFSDSESNCSLPYFDCDSDSVTSSSFDTLSTFSGDTYKSSIMQDRYQSSIVRKVKKRRHAECDSMTASQDSFSSQNEEAELVSNRSSHEMNDQPKVEESLLVHHGRTKKTWKVLFWLIFTSLFATFAYLLFVNRAIVCQRNNDPFPLYPVQGNLSQCLISQEFAQNIIVNVIAETTSHPLNTKGIHLLWLVGPVGVGKSYTKGLIQRSVGSNVRVFSLLSSLLPSNPDTLDEDVRKLINNFDHCKLNVIFIDEFDEDGTAVLLYLRSLDKYLQQQTEGSLFLEAWLDRVNVLIIVIGTHESYRVTSSDFFFTDNVEETLFAYNNLQRELLAASPFKDVFISWPLSVAPYLPFKVEEVEKCIIKQLSLLARHTDKCISESTDVIDEFLFSRNFTVKDIQKRVLSLITSNELDSNKVVPSGCKRIYRIVTSIVFGIPDSEFGSIT